MTTPNHFFGFNPNLGSSNPSLGISSSNSSLGISSSNSSLGISSNNSNSALTLNPNLANLGSDTVSNSVQEASSNSISLPTSSSNNPSRQRRPSLKKRIIEVDSEANNPNPTILESIISNKDTLTFIKSQSKSIWFAKKKVKHASEQLEKLKIHKQNSTLPSNIKVPLASSKNDNIASQFEKIRKDYISNLINILITEKEKDIANMKSALASNMNKAKQYASTYTKEILKSPLLIEMNLPSDIETTLSKIISTLIFNKVNEQEIKQTTAQAKKNIMSKIAQDAAKEEKQAAEKEIAEMIIDNKNPDKLKELVHDSVKSILQNNDFMLNSHKHNHRVSNHKNSKSNKNKKRNNSHNSRNNSQSNSRNSSRNNSQNNSRNSSRKNSHKNSRNNSQKNSRNNSRNNSQKRNSSHNHNNNNSARKSSNHKHIRFIDDTNNHQKNVNQRSRGKEEKEKGKPHQSHSSSKKL